MAHSKAANIDWDNLLFQITPTHTMFINHYVGEGPWQQGEFVPFDTIAISPAATVLNYGQGIFEGLKARRTKHDEFVLFRPEENATRFADGAERICMPPYPIEDFVEVMKEMVRRNADYVPPYHKGSLYLRPCLWGTGMRLGVAPAPEYMFVTYASPVGNYYRGNLKPVKFIVSEDAHRAAPKGVGHVKYIGNYASTMQPAQEAKAKGYQGCIYLDASKNHFIEEVGTSNFFCVIENKLITPALNSILPGITRDSIIKLAHDVLNMEVEERGIPIKEALTASECFCSGTAAVITPIGAINYQNQETIFSHGKVGPLTQKLYDLLNNIQLGEESDPFGWVVNV